MAGRERLAPYQDVQQSAQLAETPAAPAEAAYVPPKLCGPDRGEHRDRDPDPGIFREFLRIVEALASPLAQFVHRPDGCRIRDLNREGQSLFRRHAPQQQANRFRNGQTHVPERLAGAILGVTVDARADDSIGSHSGPSCGAVVATQRAATRIRGQTARAWGAEGPNPPKIAQCPSNRNRK